MLSSLRSESDETLSDTQSPVPHYALAVGLAVVVFYPRVVNLLVSPRLVIVLFAVCITGVVLVRLTTLAVPTCFAVVLAIAVWTLFKALMSSTWTDPSVATTLDRLLVVTPVFLLAGFLIALAGVIEIYLKYFVYVGSVTSVLALGEHLSGKSLLGFSAAFASYVRDSTESRALVGSDQVLVLGALLGTGAVSAALIQGRWMLPMSAVLLGGCWATGSRGPFVLGVIFVSVVVTGRRVASLVLSRVVVTALIGAMVTVGTLAVFVWTNSVAGATGETYSANYRGALYSLLPLILRAVPLGYGAASFPAGVWLMQSQLFGAVDAVKTVDSEFVYSALTFGWIGLAAVVLGLLCSGIAIAADRQVGLVATYVGATGFYLALHAWDSIGPLWLLLVGCALGVLTVRYFREASQQQQSVGWLGIKVR